MYNLGICQSDLMTDEVDRREAESQAIEARIEQAADYLCDTEDGRAYLEEELMDEPEFIEEMFKLFHLTQSKPTRKAEDFDDYGKKFACLADDWAIKIAERDYEKLTDEYPDLF